MNTLLWALDRKGEVTHATLVRLAYNLVQRAAIQCDCGAGTVALFNLCEQLNIEYMAAQWGA